MLKKKNTAVALGTFDGLHKGHIAVISEAVNLAKQNDLTPVVLLFNEHPQKHITGKVPSELITKSIKEKIIKELNAEISYISFESICNLSYEEFFEKILKKEFNAKALSCGKNYHFGNKALGDTNALKLLCEKDNIILSVLELEKQNGETISSTLIRKYIENGEIEKANEMLSRNFAYDFTVVDGEHFGRKLGVPTINQYFEEGFIKPKNGVYESKTLVEDKWYKSVTNIGIRPTLNGQTARSETHIIGFNGDLYGKNPTVAFLKYLRDEKKFDSIEELRNQILKDIKEVKEG